MNTSTSMLLIGVGTSGCAIARGILRAFGEGLDYVLADTDARTSTDGNPFVLLGGDRLAGHGAGGDVVAARLATEDSTTALDDHLANVRLVVLVTALGGGTGGGATLEIVHHLTQLGIPSIVFATTPFDFEGDDRRRNARGVMPLIEEAANATFFLPLNKLVQGEDQMDAALRRAIDTVAGGVTLFWRLVGKPGYIRLDAERIRHLLSGAGRGRFATVTVQGPNRAHEAVDALIRSELLAVASAPVGAMLCGVLAGEDLRLNELTVLSDGLRNAFGDRLAFDLATVNDEQTFCGRLSVVVMLFETTTRATEATMGGVIGGKRGKRARTALDVGPSGRGRFNNAEPTIWKNEDLDIPTFIRRNITLDL